MLSSAYKPADSLIRHWNPEVQAVARRVSKRYINCIRSIKSDPSVLKWRLRRGHREPFDVGADMLFKGQNSHINITSFGAPESKPGGSLRANIRSTVFKGGAVNWPIIPAANPSEPLTNGMCLREPRKR
jgi:hypothetical protein